MNYNKVLIVGASSGIGFHLAELFLKKGYHVGAVGRNMDQLLALKNSFHESLFLLKTDITGKDCLPCIDSLVNEMQGIDYYIHCAAIIFRSKEPEWKTDNEMIATNVVAFTMLIDHIYHHFALKNKGHITIISSIAALRGGASAPVYNASKAFQSSFAEGLFLQSKISNRKIHVLDIKPGYVETKMSQSGKKAFSVSAERSAALIANAILQNKTKEIIPFQWKLLMFFIQAIPTTTLAAVTSWWQRKHK